DWRWFVDRTPWKDRAFTTRGDQGEQGRMDLRSVLSHTTDHLPGSEHDADDLMAEALAVGTRRVPSSRSDLTDVVALDWVFADSGTALAAPLLDGSAPPRPW